MHRAQALLTVVLVALALRDVPRGASGRAPTVRHAESAAVVAALGGPLRTLRGRVEGTEHAPLVGATLDAVLVLEGRTYPIASTQSDATGAFALTDLPEGSYWLIARAPGRARRIETVRVFQGDPPPTTLALAPGASVAGSVTALRHRGDPPAPLGHIVVRAMPDGGGQGPPFAARTEPDGTFAIDGLPPGNFRVEVAEPGYEPVVRRAVPAPARGLAFVLRALASVRGVVRDDHGAPAPGAVLALAGSGVWPARSSEVHADGTFEIVGIPSGVYELRAQRGEQVAEPIAPLLLEPGDARDVTLTVAQGATLRGTVVDALTQRPIADARVVVAEDALATAPRALYAEDDGAFTVTGLLRRPHQVSARADGYVPRVGALAIPGGEPVVVALDREVVVSGRVVDSNGAPIAGAQIEVNATDLDGRAAWLTASAIAFRDALFTAQARGPRPLIPAGELGVMPGPVPVIPLAQAAGGSPASSPFASAGPSGGYVTGADGRFRIAEVPPGLVRVSASHPAYVRGEASERAVSAGETVELEIVLHAGGTIDGRLLDEGGYPIANAAIEVRAERDEMPRRAFTMRDGTFRVPSVLGHVAVVALLGGRVGARAEVDVADGAVVPVTLTMDRNVRRVRGRVLDRAGFPVPGAELSLAVSNGAGGSSRTLSGADGTFDTFVAGAGAVSLEARHPEFAPAQLRVTDLDHDVMVTLERGGALSVDVHAEGCATGEISVELRTTCGPLRRALRASGELRVDHVCPGRVQLVAQAPGCVRAEGGAQVAPGARADAPRLDLVAGGGASGDVVDSRGDPVPGAVIALADAPQDSVTGAARSDRRGEFTAPDLPDGEQRLVATHPLLGRTEPVSVRVWHGSVARGVRLRFARELAGATREAPGGAVVFAERGGHVEVQSVVLDSAASRAGLQVGDEVVSVQGRGVTTAREAAALLAGPAGDEVAVEVAHDGVRRTVRWER